MTSPPSSRTAISKGRACPQRWLLEQQRDVPAREQRLVGDPGRTCGLEGRRTFQARLEHLVIEIENRQEPRGNRCSALHPISLFPFPLSLYLLGSVLSVDPDVLGAEVARPHLRRAGAAGAQVDRDDDVAALQVFGGLRRAFVVR